ncbi:MAG: ribosome small subunit-dependent GTPase A, partial [Defluviitaleaceae bacterium]|nr:ribosome small subunit-dependent GTPase A [Defluviitaleaceae bacterium]
LPAPFETSRGYANTSTVSNARLACFYVCTARGVFRNKKITPLVGDKVKILVADAEKQIASIHEILPRKNELRRPPAANIDQVIVTVSVAQPAFNAGFLDRLLVLIEHEKIPVIICVNKVDLGDESLFEPYKQAYEIVYTDALTGEGVDELLKKMSGKINLFAGASGVGKSSLVNKILPDLNLETGPISKKIGRGKHTTRHTELFCINDGGLGGAEEVDSAGFIFDTSGFTSLEVDFLGKSALAPLFREFRPFLGECKFKNCLHVKEIGCAVKDAVGVEIHPARYDGYVKLLEGLSGSLYL